MCIFDGSSDEVIEKSLSSVFKIELGGFMEIICDYFIEKKLMK